MSADSPVIIVYGSDGSGGYEEKGTDTKPFRTDPTGDTTQPISASELPLPAGAATEETLGDIKTKTDNIPSDPAKESGKLTAIDSTLTSIKSTDGIKKIVDALPAGSNTIGKVDQGTAGASAWKTDGSGVTQPISAASLPLPAGAATETTLGNIKAKTDYIPSDPAREGGNLATLAAKDFATQTTLAAIQVHTDYIPSDPAKESGKLTTIDSTLTSIKSTDGIKKITDALPAGDNNIGNIDLASSIPAGTNEIGKVAQGTKALNIDGWPTKLVDGAAGVELAVQNGPSIPVNTRGLIIAGRDDTGKSRFARTTDRGELITSGNSYQITGFGETRVAQPHLVGNLLNKYHIDSYWYGQEVAGGGAIAHVPEMSGIRMTVGSASGDKARLRTHNYYRYQAGRSMLIRMTCFNSDTGQSNQARRWGFFDDNDGLFWELDGTSLYIVRRTSTGESPSTIRVLQSAWNKDAMDGTGPSGVTLDVTKGNIYEITFQWLGSGVVSFFINGNLVHQMNNPNSIVGPYMRTACLPLSWEVVNSGASTGANLTYVCGSVSVEGGSELPEYTFGAYTPGDVTVSSTEIPLLSIRPKLLFNSIENRMAITPLLALLSCDGGRTSYKIVLNGTLTGPSWVSADADSGTEYDITASAITGGTTLLRGLMANSIDQKELDFSSIFNSLARALRRKVFSTSAVDVLSVVGKNEKTTGGSSTMRASLTWQEVR